MWRHTRFLCTLYVFAVSVFVTNVIVYNSYKAAMIISSIKTTSSEEHTEPVTCKFPALDPFDPSIQMYWETRPPITCRRIQPDISYLDDDGQLYLNASELPSNAICAYQTFDRARIGVDVNYRLGETYIIREGPVDLNAHNIDPMDNVRVTCMDENNTGVYFNLHAHPSIGKLNSTAKQDEEHLSVLMFWQDSVSLPMFRRNLPKSYAYMTEDLGMYVMRGFTKVGDNTRPNIFTTLTGLRWQNQQDDMPDELSKFMDPNATDTLWDGLPLIFKNYTAAGYATAFIEDLPQMGVFHYVSSGFQNPSDFFTYYFYPFMRERNEGLHRTPMNVSSDLCFGNTPMYEQNIDLVERFQRLVHGEQRRYFLFAFFGELSHGTGGGVDLQRADDMIHSWLKRSYEANMFNHTVLMMLSDHGHRFGNIRETLIGQLEERMPFVSIRYPDWFYKKYPHIQTALSENQQKLATFYDLHGTLVDILESNYNDNGRREPWYSRHLSLLYPIPANRTCHIASIPQHYCVCTQSRPLNISDPIVTESADFLLKHVNNLLAVEGDRCAMFRLRRVVRADEVEVDQRVVQGIKTHDDLLTFNGTIVKEPDLRIIRVVVHSEPGGALFEATLQKGVNLTIGENQVSRINEYGNSSHCVTKEASRKYCYCTDLA